jgi:ketose-bisphosphate aldolase
MLTPFHALLAGRRSGSAVGAFTAYDLEGATAVLRAGARANAGVILLIGSKSFASEDGALLLDAIVAAAARAPDVRACVQLDHCGDLGLIEAALAAGAGAVMADGSGLSYENNVAFVSSAVELARHCGAGVEAELGTINGDEDVAQAVAAGALTDPDEAVDFIGRCGAHCLAVSIGNVHGLYREPPQLDFDRLTSIRGRCPVPLSLHGASGISDAIVAHAIRSGIAKINVNTELRAAYLEVTMRRTPELLDGGRLADLHAAQVAAVQAVVAAKLAAFEESTDDPSS